MLAGLFLSGCKTLEGGPARLYTVPQEVAIAQDLLPGMRDRYEAAATENDRMFYRNEYIARRMYIIDVEYSEFEVALTRERQQVGFATSLVQQGLNTAASLVTVAETTRILSGLAGATSATRGFYDSEVVIAKTIQIAQGHMRAQRDTVAKNILALRGVSSTIYPLSAALLDLEDYYRAGTLTTGLIEAVGAAGLAATDAANDKLTVLPRAVFAIDDSTTRLRAYYMPGGVTIAAKRNILNGCLTSLGEQPARIQAYLGDTSPLARSVRERVIQCAIGLDRSFPS
jgi:hypothetical protein